REKVGGLHCAFRAISRSARSFRGRVAELLERYYPRIHGPFRLCGARLIALDFQWEDRSPCSATAGEGQARTGRSRHASELFRTRTIGYLGESIGCSADWHDE